MIPTPEEIAKAQRMYHKKWRDKNKDKIKKYKENYWKRMAEKNRHNSDMKGDETHAKNENDSGSISGNQA